MKTKQDIRKEILKMRSSLSSEDVRALSMIICSILQVMDVYRNAADICLYMPVRNEVDVTMLTEAAQNEGKGVWLPRVAGGEMKFCRYDKNTELVEGAYGIKEPDSSEILEPDEKTLVIMPGAAFSEKHEHIGYGGGYYDRFLAEYPQCTTAAVCYDFQIMPELPSEMHDVRPDIIISQERVLFK